ncbi:hypothetical protein BDZ85DRAFT_121524 [Elsinoe ampelina]|uniref:F-box domain-containing protein n=1 Tax=Elsinoe ampelina TaxID=302913 RepID=A0A6A6GBY8_9PEZI|nr:hypothetical protein BDZ85DRAFT_121524 [Elsinoe ampelina]
MILDYLANADLKAVRLTCHVLIQVSSSALYKVVNLCPSKRSLQAWSQLIQHEQLRFCPRLIEIYTKEGETGGLDKRPWVDAVTQQLPQLQSLQSVKFHLSVLCRTPNTFGGLIENEDLQVRRQLLNALSSGLTTFAQAYGRSIENVTLFNPRDASLGARPAKSSKDLRDLNHEAFSKVLSQLQSLHLFVLSDQDTYDGPFYLERESFPLDLAKKWLPLCSQQLTSLTLCFDAPWGALDCSFDADGLELPLLTSLTLGSYTVDCEHAFDWVLRCKRLRNLSLYACSIVVLLMESIYHSRPESFPRRLIGRMSSEFQWFEYQVRWYHLFDKIAAALPDLHDFDFYDNFENEFFYDHLHRKTRMSSDRYLVFDWNFRLDLDLNLYEDLGCDTEEISPLLTDASPRSVHEKTGADDSRALKGLLRACSSRGGLQRSLKVEMVEIRDGSLSPMWVET